MQSALVKRRTTTTLIGEKSKKGTTNEAPRRRGPKAKPTIVVDNMIQDPCKVKILLSPAPSIKNDSTRCSTNNDDE